MAICPLDRLILGINLALYRAAGAIPFNDKFPRRPYTLA